MYILVELEKSEPDPKFPFQKETDGQEALVSLFNQLIKQQHVSRPIPNSPSNSVPSHTSHCPCLILQINVNYILILFSMLAHLS